MWLEQFGFVFLVFFLGCEAGGFRGCLGLRFGLDAAFQAQSVNDVATLVVLALSLLRVERATSPRSVLARLCDYYAVIYKLLFYTCE